MKIFNTRKGTDKPIEIFIALFIILAVAMVILQMFSKQISSKTKDIKTMEIQQKVKQDLDNARQSCEDSCTNALRNDCSDAQRAQFCLTYAKSQNLDGLDLDADGVAQSFITDQFGGIGACEDRVYCPLLVQCTCGQKLTMDQCKEVLCQYWHSSGISDAQRNNMLTTLFGPGTCYNTASPQPNHWYTTIGGGTTPLTCPAAS